MKIREGERVRRADGFKAMKEGCSHLEYRFCSTLCNRVAYIPCFPPLCFFFSL